MVICECDREVELYVIGEDGGIDNFSLLCVCVCVVVMRVEEVDSFTTHLYNPPLHTHFKSERE